MTSEAAFAAQPMSPSEYCQLATRPVSGYGYSRLPPQLLDAEQALRQSDSAVAAGANRSLCLFLLDGFRIEHSPWVVPGAFRSLYEAQLERIEDNLKHKGDAYFSLFHDPFLKDLAILRHRLIPCGAELATPFSGISRALLIKGGWRQALDFFQVIARCGGIKPFLELHMHPQCTAAFNPAGWIQTYENLADFLALNPSFLGVQSTSWFLDPALEKVSPHLAYLRLMPERCGAAVLYAGKADPQTCGALDTSASRRTLHALGQYRPRLYTRIWPRANLLQRQWRAAA